MRKFTLVSILVLALARVVFVAFTDIELHPSYTLCGMGQGEYSQSRMLIEYEDGTSC